MHQDVAVLEDALHVLAVGDEVRAQVAAVELHALDQLDGRLQRLALFDGDDAVLADLLHGVGDLLADLGVVVGGDGADEGDVLPAAHGAADVLQLGDDGVDGLLHAALEGHGVGAGGDVLQGLLEDGLGQDGGGGGAVAGLVAGLGGGLLDHLRAHVLEVVLQLDFLGDGDAVLGHRGGAEALLDDDGLAARAERHLDGARKLVDAPPHRLAGLCVVCDLLRRHVRGLLT